MQSMGSPDSLHYDAYALAATRPLGKRLDTGGEGTQTVMNVGDRIEVLASNAKDRDRRTIPILPEVKEVLDRRRKGRVRPDAREDPADQARLTLTMSLTDDASASSVSRYPVDSIHYAGVAELADASDLKSEGLKRSVWVRFPPPAVNSGN